ncbi:MAG: hypothetical protein E8D46_08245 [Nitrospira sp.]|nr:hypothetical protein [Nitrospira sp.]TKB73863.1 MAG: hypothetical protein E8D46_08245 [Nitrospira sp.]
MGNGAPCGRAPQGTASPRLAAIIPPDPEVVATPTRRHFTAEDKLRILKLADACTAVGRLGALLRAEGPYASNLTTWRRQRTAGMLSALTPQKRGRKVSAQYPLRTENDTLRKENARLSTRLKQALRDKRFEHKQYIAKYGEDMPEIRNWRWSGTV